MTLANSGEKHTWAKLLELRREGMKYKVKRSSSQGDLPKTALLWGVSNQFQLYKVVVLSVPPSFQYQFQNTLQPTRAIFAIFKGVTDPRH